MQGDPLSMPFYAVSTYIFMMVPCIVFEDVKQAWLADDAVAAANWSHYISFSPP